MAKQDYDHKLKITLTLTEEEASALLDTLAAGASARYAPTLQARSNAIKKLVQKRYDAAVQARRRARLRADQRKLATDAIMTRVGQSVQHRTPRLLVDDDQRAYVDQGFASARDEYQAERRIDEYAAYRSANDD